jgi:hypothetical protein
MPKFLAFRKALFILDTSCGFTAKSRNPSRMAFWPIFGILIRPEQNSRKGAEAPRLYIKTITFVGSCHIHFKQKHPMSFVCIFSNNLCGSAPLRAFFFSRDVSR